jgi:hypothetical protein
MKGGQEARCYVDGILGRAESRSNGYFRARTEKGDRDVTGPPLGPSRGQPPEDRSSESGCDGSSESGPAAQFSEFAAATQQPPQMVN